jgi:hypothetical protein
VANRLAQETSPYLQQHKDNPVDWFPWSDEALARARELDRPLLVSIGYAACHWCHVMERESFEDEQIAALMNESFVPIKVDREERPDVDAICMEACQAINGHGGWPLNVFLTPEQTPFFAGTYFPPDQRLGSPSWRMVLQAVSEAWMNRRDQVREQGTRLAGSIAAAATAAPTDRAEGAWLSTSLIDDSVQALAQTFDARNGGWGGAPKFPPHCTLEFLLAAGEPAMALSTLQAMARGGIHDQLGGGFARYAVDAAWTVPHFEKMLYDNALLARAYLHGWQVSGEPRLREVCERTLDFALRELGGPEGGFCSSLDADSEGVEGKFYVWSTAELREILGNLADEAIAYFGASERGNFEGGMNVLEERGPRPPSLEEIRKRLLDARDRRVRPARDDKRLTAWNALMISALADASAVLDRHDYLEAAGRCAAFVLSSMRADDGRLLRTWKDGPGGRAHIAGYLEDHAFMLQALLVLYEASFDERWYLEAVAIAELMLEHFADPAGHGFFTTASDQATLVARVKDMQDAPIPSGNSAAALGLLRLARLSGEARYERAAAGVVELYGPLAARHPPAFGHLLQAIDFQLAPALEVAIVAPGRDDDGAAALTRIVRHRFRPHEVVAGAQSDQRPAVPLLEGRGTVDERAAAYVCERFACQVPITDPEVLQAALP